MTRHVGPGWIRYLASTSDDSPGARGPGRPHAAFSTNKTAEEHAALGAHQALGDDCSHQEPLQLLRGTLITYKACTDAERELRISKTPLLNPALQGQATVSGGFAPRPAQSRRLVPSIREPNLHRMDLCRRAEDIRPNQGMLAKPPVAMITARACGNWSSPRVGAPLSRILSTCRSETIPNFKPGPAIPHVRLR